MPLTTLKAFVGCFASRFLTLRLTGMREFPQGFDDPALHSHKQIVRNATLTNILYHRIRLRAVVPSYRLLAFQVGPHSSFLLRQTVYLVLFLFFPLTFACLSFCCLGRT